MNHAIFRNWKIMKNRQLWSQKIYWDLRECLKTIALHDVIRSGYTFLFIIGKNAWVYLTDCSKPFAQIWCKLQRFASLNYIVMTNNVPQTRFKHLLHYLLSVVIVKPNCFHNKSPDSVRDVQHPNSLIKY